MHPDYKLRYVTVTETIVRTRIASIFAVSDEAAVQCVRDGCNEDDDVKYFRIEGVSDARL